MFFIFSVSCGYFYLTWISQYVIIYLIINFVKVSNLSITNNTNQTKKTNNINPRYKNNFKSASNLTQTSINCNR